MLWTPFLLVAHAGVLIARVFGAHVLADGFSLPYLMAMAVGTLVYGFAALLLSYRVACQFVAERWALLATIAICWASSLPVYMYFNPSWSHAHSAFCVALFIWYWLRTREDRSLGQWAVMALIAGLMLNVYYPNALVLGVLIPEGIAEYKRTWKRSASKATTTGRLFFRHSVFCLVSFLSLLPTLLTKYYVYGWF